MLSKKVLINILVLPIVIKRWRCSTRKYLRKKWISEDVQYKKSFNQFKENLKIFSDCPEEFSFPNFKQPLVSIIIPVYNQYRYTLLCLWAILEQTHNVPYEVILADDSSTDATKEIEKHIRNIKVIHNKENKRFLKNCNEAALFASGKYVLFLNNDTQVQENWLSPLVRILENDSSVGLCGGKLIYPDGTLQEAGGIIFKDAGGWNYGRNDLPVKGEYNYLKDVDYISGACILLSKKLWDSLGGFDERFAPAYYEDTDLAFQIHKKGLKVIYQPLSRIVHFEGKSNGTDISSGQKKYQLINQEKFYQKWQGVLKKQGTSQDLFLARDRSRNKKTLLFVDFHILTYDQDTGSRASFQYLQFFVNQGLSVKFLCPVKLPQDYHLEAIQNLGVEVICLGDKYNNHYQKWLQENGKYIDYIYLNRPDIFLV